MIHYDTQRNIMKYVMKYYNYHKMNLFINRNNSIETQRIINSNYLMTT